MTSPQVPSVPSRPVGQPVNPVGWFRRCPGGGTVFVKATSEATDSQDDPVVCFESHEDRPPAAASSLGLNTTQETT